MIWHTFCCLDEQKGRSAMKVALTIWYGRISPVFDVCREVLVCEIDKQDIISSTKVDLENAGPIQKIERILGLGVEKLICGAISKAIHQEAIPRGLEVIAFVAGEIDTVMQAFVAGELPTPALSMPGCCTRKRRFRNGRVCKPGRKRK
jgi:predicted Fe-Mo cluster-binding NifX family protein